MLQKPLPTFALGILLTACATAQTIDFTGINTNASGSSVSEGTLSVLSPLSINGASGTITYRVSGTDLGSVTGLNSLDVVINFAVDTGNFAVVGDNGLGSSTGVSGELNPNQALTLTAGAVTTNLGAGASASFVGFNQLLLIKGDGAGVSNTGNFGSSDRYDLDVDNDAQDVTAGNANDSDTVSFDGSQTVTVTSNDSAGGGGFSLRDFNFSISLGEGDPGGGDPGDGGDPGNGGDDPVFSPDAPRPNILFVFVDDMGWGSIGANGQTMIKTPNLDTVAAQGINFSRAYGPPVCSPSRTSQQTGYHQGHTWTDWNGDINNSGPRADDPTIGEALSGGGYRTAYFGKWGFGADGNSKNNGNAQIIYPQTLPNNKGYDVVFAELNHTRAHNYFQPTLWRYDASDANPSIALSPNNINNRTSGDYPEYPTYYTDPAYPDRAYCDDAYTFEAIDFIRGHVQNSSDPFYCQVSLHIPHDPFNDIPAMPKWFDAYDDVNTSGWSNGQKQIAAMITRADGLIGNLLATLEDPNNDGDTSDSIVDNTLVIFSSDNGGTDDHSNFFSANGDLRGYKRDVFEGGIRIPMLMRWPAQLSANITTTMKLDSIDLLPTFCELAGVEIPTGLDGVSIAPTLTGDGQQRIRPFGIYEDNTPQDAPFRHSAIRRGDYKLTYINNSQSLFNLATDPTESENIIDENQALADELFAILQAEGGSADDSFANTYHSWTGADGASTSAASNWSDYTHFSLSDSGAPSLSWTASMHNDGTTDSTAVADADIATLSLDIRGQTHLQILDLGAHTLTGRNEIRVAENGQIDLGGGQLDTIRWVDVKSGGAITGHGSVNGTLYNEGLIQISDAITVSGDYSESADATLQLGVSGTSITENTARLQVSGTATLAGELLSIEVDAGYTPFLGDTLTIVSAGQINGTFSNTNQQINGSNGEVFAINYTATDVTLTVIDGARPAPSTGPNIIHILVDDMGYTDHSVASLVLNSPSELSDFVETPNIAQLASEGVSFTWSYTQPNCAPSRAAFMSGQYSPRSSNGVYNVRSLDRSDNLTAYTNAAVQGSNDGNPDEDDYISGEAHSVPLAQAMNDAGYITCHIGKYHVGSGNSNDSTHPLNQGLDYNYGGNDFGQPNTFIATNGTWGNKVGPELDAFGADYTQAYVDKYLKPYENGNNTDSLVGTGKHLTDAVIDAFEDFMADYKTKDNGAYASHPAYVQLHFYATHSPMEGRPDLVTKYQNKTPRPTLDTRNHFAALAENMDQSVARLMDYLEDPNFDGDTSDSIAENTLIVWTTDNGGAESGPYSENLPQRGEKGMHLEGGIRVPTIMRMPGTIPAGKISDSLMHAIDFYPTFLDFAANAANTPNPNAATHPLDGESLFAHVTDPDNVAHDRAPIFYHFPGYMDNRAYPSSTIIKEINGKRYKYIYNYDPYYVGLNNYAGKAPDQHQLYCLSDDPYETTNLLDYIDLENSIDANDDSLSREYWDYLLHKEKANLMAAELHAWLTQDDPTWEPLFTTYKQNFIDASAAEGQSIGVVGQATAPAPASIPDAAEVSAPEDFSFQALAPVALGGGDLQFSFDSHSGFYYQVQASNTLAHDSWVDIGDTWFATGDSSQVTVNDPDSLTSDKRFYRVVLVE